jgi:deoxycytidylate deaminase
MNITKSHRAYFKAAKSMSDLSDFPRVKVGCVAVYKHKVISSGCNSYVTNPLQKRYNKFRFETDATLHSKHAEVDCLLPLINRKDIDFSRVSLYIFRQYKSGELGMARPCDSCFNLIKDLGIRTVYYTGDGSYINEEIIY